MKKEIKVVRDTEEEEKEFLTYIAVGLYSFTGKSQGSYIDISFHPKMKPFLLQLQTQFLMYDVRNVLQLQSSFSVRIYELLKQYERIGRRTFTLTELKETLAVADKYPLYANFKQRVILKAQEDLENYTDIRFTFEEDKRGKAVHSLVFYIYSNKTIVEERKQPEEVEIPSIDITENQIYDKLKEHEGVNLKTVKEWIEKYSLNYVAERVDMLKRQQSNGTVIKNPMGYLQKLMQQEVLFYPQVIEPKKVVIDVTEQNLRLQSIKYHEKSLEDLRINYYEQQNEIIKTYFEENPIVKEELLESLKFGYDYNRQLSVPENLQRDSFKALLNSKVRENYPHLFKELNETFRRQEITIKQALRSLGWSG